MLNRAMLTLGLLVSFMFVIKTTIFRRTELQAPSVEQARGHGSVRVSVSESYDFVRRPLGLDVSLSRIITNETEHPLRVRIGRKSCGCLNAELSGDFLPPHGEITVNATISSPPHAEHKNVRLWLNVEPESQEVSPFTIPIDFKAEFFSSIEVSWSSVTQSAGVVVVKNVGDAPVYLGVFGCPNPVHVEVGDNDSIKIPIDFSEMSDSLRLEVNDGAETRFIPRPASREFANLQIVPRALILGEVFVENKQVRSSKPAELEFSGVKLVDVELQIISLPEILHSPTWTDTESGKTLSCGISDPRLLKNLNGVLRVSITEDSGISDIVTIPVVAVRR